MQPLLIITGEWMTTREKSHGDWHSAARRAIRAYPNVTCWQASNEVDLDGPSSETMPAVTYSDVLAQCRRGLGPDITLLSAGAGGSEPSYWDDVDLSPADTFALHMATRTAANMGDRVVQYQRFGLPIAVTEFYAEHLAYTDEHERAVDVSAMLVAMADAGVEAAMLYAFSDRQFPGGLVNGRGKPWEAYAAMADSA